MVFPKILEYSGWARSLDRSFGSLAPGAAGLPNLLFFEFPTNWPPPLFSIQIQLAMNRQPFSGGTQPQV